MPHLTADARALRRPLAPSSALTSLTALVLASALSSSARAEVSHRPLGPELSVITQGAHHGGAMPLKAIEVSVEVTEGLADVKVQHVFDNPYEVPLEVLYTFPLPDGAAVDRMSIVMGERTIRGVVKTREAAKKTYEEAKARGQTAALLDQERANVFTQQVANVPPGEAIVVEVGYRDRVPVVGGRFELVVPTTVGPRFTPGGSTADVAKVTPPVRLGHREGAPSLRVNVELQTGLKLAAIDSPSHPIVVNEERGGAKISLDAAEVPNRDFLLHYRLGEATPSASLTAHRVGEQGYVMLQLMPQLEAAAEDIVARELVFVVDNSGSMGGQPMHAAKGLVRLALEQLRPTDRFQILRFSESASAMSDEALLASAENLELGRRYIDNMAGMGGTMMIEGIKAALDPEVPEGTLRIVLFLTDGYIGNDEAIIGEVQKRMNDDTRLFSLGVGSSPNRFLLDSMARVGRGAVATVGLSEDPGPVVERFYRRIDAPVLTHLDVATEGVVLSDLTPLPLPDLFAEEPLVLFGRYTQPGRGVLTVTGRVGQRSVRLPVEVTLPPHEPQHAAIAAMWARQTIADLEREGRYGLDQDARAEVTRLALEHQLMSKYTSFVAVDERVRVDPDGERVLVHQPVEMPDGVSLEGIAAAQLTRTAIPPGDPVLSIDAPGARRVVAHFPFGMTKTLRKDGEGRWFARFLVPKGFADAAYYVRVVITEADGSRRIEEVPYTLDGDAPELDVEVLTGIRGYGAVVRVKGSEALSEVVVSTPWGKTALVAEDEDDPHTFTGYVLVPDDAALGDAVLHVVALDEAGNTGHAQAAIEVIP